MKPSHFVLVTSVAANVALMAFLLLRTTPAATRPPPVSAKPAASAVSGTTSPAGATSLSAPTNSAAESKPWAFLGAHDDIPALAQKLRDAGCPPDILRVIVVESYQMRRQELTFDGNDTPYWKNPPPGGPGAKVAEEIAKLGRESRALLQQLGLPAEETDETLVVRQRQFGSIPREKIMQVEAVLARHNDNLQAAPPINSAGTTPEAQAMQYTQLNRELRDEIAQVLTPAELLEFEMRNGPTANRLRSTLTGFNPTEVEYRALFMLYQAQDAKVPPTAGLQGFGPRTPEAAAALAEAQRHTDEQVRALLSPERFAQYQQASRPEYQMLNRLVTRLELPLSAAAQVVAVQQETQQQANAVRFNAQISPTERTEQLAALSRDATAKITSVIGARGMEGYTQYGGQWLQQLQQPPRPATKAR